MQSDVIFLYSVELRAYNIFTNDSVHLGMADMYIVKLSFSVVTSARYRLLSVAVCTTIFARRDGFRSQHTVLLSCTINQTVVFYTLASLSCFQLHITVTGATVAKSGLQAFLLIPTFYI